MRPGLGSLPVRILKCGSLDHYLKLCDRTMQLTTLAPALALLLLLLALIFIRTKHRTKAPCPNLPPGSLGWPVLGESLAFLSANQSRNPGKFVRDRIDKHGSLVFKTSLMGEPMVVLCGPAGNKFLFSNEGKKVALWWPTSVRRLIGTSLITKVGEEGRSDRKMLMNFFNPEALMRFVGTMDEVTRHHLNTQWQGKDQVEAYPTLKLYTFELACRLFMSITEPQLIARLADHFQVFLKGLISLPLNIPGTRFHRAMRATDSIRKELRALVRQRREELEKKLARPSQDIMSYLLVNEDENGKLMPEAEIINNILNLLFAGHDTSSSTLMLLLKYLSELPRVLDRILAEQREIAASKAPGELLQWDDLQRMKYSWNVLCEVMRMTPPVSGSFREALDDFTYEGYTIPKGWKLYWSATLTHEDPTSHPRAASFDESRFDGSGPPPYSYVPFGGGPRMCLGKEFARVEMLVFLHNLVNTFDWDLVIPDEKIIYDPMPTPVKGLPVRLRPR